MAEENPVAGIPIIMGGVYPFNLGRRISKVGQDPVEKIEVLSSEGQLEATMEITKRHTINGIEILSGHIKHSNPTIDALVIFNEAEMKVIGAARSQVGGQPSTGVFGGDSGF